MIFRHASASDLLEALPSVASSCREHTWSSRTHPPKGLLQSSRIHRPSNKSKTILFAAYLPGDTTLKVKTRGARLAIGPPVVSGFQYLEITPTKSFGS